MRILYNGADIYRDVSLHYAVHEMHAEKQADTLDLRFNDPRGVWSKWAPKPGDRIAFEHGSAKTGAMFIYTMKAENGLYTVRAMSMPLSGAEKRSKSWAAVHFIQLCGDAARRHGLSLKVYGVKDQVYTYMEQDNESDFAFLSRLSGLEGCQIVIYDGSLIVYREAYIEQQAPAGELRVGDAGIYGYSSATGLAYGSAEITGGNICGRYNDAHAEADRVLRLPSPVRLNSPGEAARYAGGLLREANKYGMAGYVSKKLTEGCAAGSVLTLKTSKASAWDGKIFVSKVRHDYVANKSAIYFRRIILEGY